MHQIGHARSASEHTTDLIRFGMAQRHCTKRVAYQNHLGMPCNKDTARQQRYVAGRNGSDRQYHAQALQPLGPLLGRHLRPRKIDPAQQCERRRIPEIQFDRHPFGIIVEWQSFAAGAIATIDRPGQLRHIDKGHSNLSHSGYRPLNVCRTRFASGLHVQLRSRLRDSCCSKLSKSAARARHPQ